MIRIGVIGVGHWGPNLIRNFQDHARSEVVAVADSNPERLARIRSAYPGLAATTQANDIIGDASIDAVVIATPTSTHYSLARAALLANKHVLVEKPIATTAAEGEALGEIAARTGKALMVGHVFLFNAAIRYVKGVIDRGELGRLYCLSMTRTNLGPVRADVNAAWDLAAHDLSIADYWLGTPPVAVRATGGSWINAGVDDAVFAVVRYPNDVLVNLHCSWLNPRKVRDITVVGERKMLTFDDMNLTEPVRIYDKHVDGTLTSVPFADTFASFRASVREGDVLIPRVSTGEPLREECAHFIECVEQGKAPLTGAAGGVSVVRTLEAFDRSMKNCGREESVLGA